MNKEPVTAIGTPVRSVLVYITKRESTVRELTLSGSSKRVADC